MIPTASRTSELMRVAGLAIRPFVRGKDEALWVDIHNRTWREDEDFTPETVEESKRWEDAPWVGVRTRLIAEVDGAPAARVRAETDKTMTEKKGYLGGPDVLPEHRRKGIGTALIRQGLACLSSAGMDVAESFSFDNVVARGFLGAMGFEIVRRFSRMRRSLAEVPAGIGEAVDAEVATLDRTDADIGLMVGIRNEAFKEHFDYSPGKVEDWRFAIDAWDKSGNAYITVARVAGEPAGYLSYGIDLEENKHLRKKRGGLWDIGVLRQFRGRGIAKRLMIDAMKHLQREGMEEAELGVDETNVTNAMKLYERLGFAVARRRLVWHKELAGFDARAHST
jgi:ribosomal protein S18 acetylase RimI-like enzyme